MANYNLFHLSFIDDNCQDNSLAFGALSYDGMEVNYVDPHGSAASKSLCAAGV